MNEQYVQFIIHKLEINMSVIELCALVLGLFLIVLLWLFTITEPHTDTRMFIGIGMFLMLILLSFLAVEYLNTWYKHNLLLYDPASFLREKVFR